VITGYARVATEDQSLGTAHEDALLSAGAARVFTDRVGGSVLERPELSRLFDQPRDGDVVVMTKSDRRARSLTSCVSSRTRTAGWASARWRRTSTRLDARLDEHEMNWDLKPE
jgi:DNA invertase Pin-like site-specific DNA recombinase